MADRGLLFAVKDVESEAYSAIAILSASCGRKVNPSLKRINLIKGTKYGTGTNGC